MSTNATNNYGYSEAEIDAMGAEQPPAWLVKNEAFRQVNWPEIFLHLADRIAKEHYDGHLTIWRFTTGWKAFFGTPDVWNADRGAVLVRRTAPTLGAALEDAIRSEPDGYIRIEFAIGEATAS